MSSAIRAHERGDRPPYGDTGLDGIGGGRCVIRGEGFGIAGLDVVGIVHVGRRNGERGEGVAGGGRHGKTGIEVVVGGEIEGNADGGLAVEGVARGGNGEGGSRGGGN